MKKLVLFFFLFIAFFCPNLTRIAHAQVWSLWTPMGNGLYWRIQRTGQWKMTFNGVRYDYWNWQFRNASNKTVNFDYGVDTAPGPVINLWYADLQPSESSRVMGDYFLPTPTLYIRWRTSSQPTPQPATGTPSPRVNNPVIRTVPAPVNSSRPTNITTPRIPSNTITPIRPNISQEVPLYYYPLVSPDGKKLAFVAKRKGISKYDLCVANIDGTEQVTITQLNVLNDSFCFSPDSSRIAFINSSREATAGGNTLVDSELSVANIDGTALKILIPWKKGNKKSLSFNRDGTKLVFVGFPELDGEIYVINADGTNEKRLTNDRRPDVNPIFTTDNQHVVYMTVLPVLFGRFQVTKVRDDGTNGEIISDHTPAEQPVLPEAKQNIFLPNSLRYSRLTMSPDGSKFAYTYYNTRNTELCVFSSDGHVIKRLVQQDLTEKPDVALSYPDAPMFRHRFQVAGLLDPQFSPDGTRLLFVSHQDGNDEIYSLSSDGLQLQRLTNSTTADHSPLFNGDGSKILYCSSSGADSVNDGIYSMNLDGSDSKQIVVDDISTTESPFTAKNNFILYISQISTKREIRSINLDGGDGQPLLKAPELLLNPPVITTPPNTPDLNSIQDAIFSPDGSKVAYVRQVDNNSEIFVMDVDGKRIRQITRHPAEDRGPSFSSDGNRLVFYSTRDSETEAPNKSEIYSVNVDGTDLQRLTNDKKVSSTTPAFSPDGTMITYVTSDAGETEINAMQPDGTQQKRLTSNLGADTSPIFSPDSNQIAYVSQRENKYDIYLMNYDGKNQRKLTNDGESKSSLVFSPDGLKIAYTMMIQKKSIVGIVEADGSYQQEMTDSLHNCQGPVFNRDGSQLAFVRITSPSLNYPRMGLVSTMLPAQAVPELLPRTIHRGYAMSFDNEGLPMMFATLNNELQIISSQRRVLDGPALKNKN